ncbi:unnamed protein product [Ectocarpus sp. CCAP 1310/34]|nr:unnamed protein product [Ectocarpus sp. CCAP 1310/34]
MVSNRTRPKSISAERRDYYLKQANGRELLEGVEIIPGAEEATDAKKGWYTLMQMLRFFSFFLFNIAAMYIEKGVSNFVRSICSLILAPTSVP